MERSKRYLAVKEKVDRTKFYTVEEAVKLMKECATAKFDESADAAFRLAVDPKKNEHRIRGTVTLPHGTGKPVTVLAFAKGDKLKEAQEAGADFAGGEDLVKRIEEGWMEFDRVVATPDMMGIVSKLGKVLGPRGLMPSPKSGTVTPDIGAAIKELKRGKLEFRLDEYGNVHSTFGRCSFSVAQLKENLVALAAAILDEKPADIKGRFIKSVTISSTIGPGIKVDPDDLQKLVAAKRL
ncbi:50S ribosomal protein L1 [bacterium HR07]|uniref:Large ribosomal subunit protein uL1 n=2 Tax=Candidatus Bipolaricaulota TaxID=67810 RepID=H5SPV2_9BACT|nr:50S ribosomal protein L1 [uncultured Acetothermia bacterium]BAL58188.1 50S ribosomal protein L1 [uncultured Acetothermia bacterium]BAL59900.1 50S ribosomal protein L1 [Candidatus Acetothermum autotrophicum]GBC75849.1 50S ribosomal protein L1 [bacterium HR07]